MVVFLNLSGILYMVSEQLNFSRMGLSAPCPTPSYPGGPMFSVAVVPLAFRPYMTAVQTLPRSHDVDMHV